MKRKRGGTPYTVRPQKRRRTKRPQKRTRPSDELKFFDVDIDDAVIAQNWTIQAHPLTIPEGTADDERIGRKIQLTNLNWRWTLVNGDTQDPANSTDTVRLMAIQDKQANGAQPAITDIFASNNFQSFNNLTNKGRFRTLYDETIDLSLPSGAGAGNGTTDTFLYGKKSVSGAVYKDLNIPIEYSGATGAVTEVRTNNIIFLAGSRSGLCLLDSKVRFRYLD